MLGFQNNIMVTMLNNDRPKKLNFKENFKKKKTKEETWKKTTTKRPACPVTSMKAYLYATNKETNTGIAWFLRVGLLTGNGKQSSCE